MITDGEPTAHITRGRRRLLQLPAGAGDGRGDVARSGALHTRGHPHQHLRARRHERADGVHRDDDADQPRPAFYTTNEALGDYVLVDFLEHRRRLARRARRLSGGSSSLAATNLSHDSRNAPLRGIGYGMRESHQCSYRDGYITAHPPYRSQSGRVGTHQGRGVQAICNDTTPRRAASDFAAGLAGRCELPGRRPRPVLPRAGSLHAEGQGGLPRLRGPRAVPRVRAPNGEKFGIWGGLSERERRRIRRQRAQAARSIVGA